MTFLSAISLIICFATVTALVSVLARIIERVFMGFIWIATRVIAAIIGYTLITVLIHLYTPVPTVQFPEIGGFEKPPISSLLDLTESIDNCIILPDNKVKYCFYGDGSVAAKAEMLKELKK